jgi:hypothetical protein
MDRRRGRPGRSTGLATGRRPAACPAARGCLKQNKITRVQKWTLRMRIQCSSSTSHTAIAIIPAKMHAKEWGDFQIAEKKLHTLLCTAHAQEQLIVLIGLLSDPPPPCSVKS